MIKEPLFFQRNRVGRVYTGGKLFHGFFGDEDKDGYEPEEWIASAVRAVNRVPKSEREGVSVLENGAFFDDLLKEEKEALLGKDGTMRILVKALDSSIRLPAQVHPDKAFSRENFNSSYGKTECWLILDTRPDAKIFFGFKEGVTERDLLEAVAQSETEADAMENLMRAIPVKKGDVCLVPARTVHAIGKGCLILEVQEPTDFTIQPERFCGEYRLSDEEMYLGLPKEKALSCFDFGTPPCGMTTPTAVYEKDGVKKDILIGEQHTDCFNVNRITLTGGAYEMARGGYAVYVVTEGEGEIFGKDYCRKIKKGEYFFMPACLNGQFTLRGNLEVAECY